MANKSVGFQSTCQRKYIFVAESIKGQLIWKTHHTAHKEGSFWPICIREIHSDNPSLYMKRWFWMRQICFLWYTTSLVPQKLNMLHTGKSIHISLAASGLVKGHLYLQLPYPGGNKRDFMSVHQVRGREIITLHLLSFLFLPRLMKPTNKN